MVVSRQWSSSLSTDPTVHRLCIHQRLDNLFGFHIVDFFVSKINVKLTAFTNIETMPVWLLSNNGFLEIRNCVVAPTRSFFPAPLASQRCILGVGHMGDE